MAASKHIHLGASGILVRNWKPRKGPTIPQVLLGKRDDNDPSLPGQWCSPGGGVEFGETIEQAIKREFIEEVKLWVVVSRAWNSVQEKIVGGRHTVLVFREVAIHQWGHNNPVAGEGFSEVDWFSFRDVQNGLRVTDMTYAALYSYFNQ